MYKILILIVVFVMSGCLEKRDEELIVSGNSAKTHKESGLLTGVPAVSHDDTVILNLESTIAHEGDTGTIGVDVVTYEFTHSVNQTVCLEEHDDIKYQLVIKDSADEEIAHINDGECETIDVSEGIYTFYISKTSNSRSLGENSSVFIRPSAETTYCDDYKSADYQIPPEETIELKAVNHCTEDPNLICTMPETYADIPPQCTLRGPWYYSDQRACVTMTRDKFPECYDYLHKNCDSIKSLCKDYWQEWSTRDVPYDDWGDSGINIWTKCFGGNFNQYVNSKYSKIANPVIKTAFQKLTEDFCEDVEADCISGWRIGGLIPAGCSGFVKYSKYGDLKLKTGEVAIHQRTYQHMGRSEILPQNNSIVMVINGRCDNVTHRVGAYITGPQTQIVVYPFFGFHGKPIVFTNDASDHGGYLEVPAIGISDRASLDPTLKDLIYSTTSSISVTSVKGTEEDLCRIKDAGVVCDSSTKWDIAPKMTGEIVLVKMADETIKVGKNCSAAFLFDYRCDNINKLGLRSYLPGKLLDVSRAILFDSDTFLRTFNKTKFIGSVKVSQGSSSVPSTVYLDEEWLQSIHAYKRPDYNHTILVSLRKCCGCNLENVSFSGDDLSNTVLVGSNMKGSLFSNANLAGSDLRKTSLQNAKFSNVKLGDNYFGCADLSRVDMSDPANSRKSTATVSGASNWDISSTFNGISVSCDASATNLTFAKVPIQILPKESWKTIQLQNTTLLDKTDGYDLSGLDLSNGDYSGLRAGGGALNMQGANLKGSDLTDADFSSIDFSPLITDKKAQYSNFSSTKIGGASFANANLEGADFKSITVDAFASSVNFSYALMMNTVLTDADLGRVDLSYAYFFSKFRDSVTIQKKAKAENIIAQDAVFTGSFLSNMTFANVKFKNCNFNGAQLVGTSFISGDLSNSKFSDAYLHGADFTGAELIDASFSGAYLSLKDGYWQYSSDDAECSEIRINYKKTKLGQTATIICPNGEKGPCDSDEKLTRKDKKIVEPPCVDGDEDIFGNTDCISHEYLEKNTIPKCDQKNDGVMQCGCLMEGE